MNPTANNTFLVISQVFIPDPAAVGQHMADVAAEMAQRGHQVKVYTANRGYDNPNDKYLNHEFINQVEVHRLPYSSFGKGSLLVRLIAQISFLGQVVVRGIFTTKLSGILITTSPPTAAAAALIISIFKRVPINYWVMDINPDQAIAVGKVKPHSVLVHLFNLLNRLILKKAASVITLDHFMADKILSKLSVHNKLTIIPPWPHTDQLDPISHQQNPFRERYNPHDKFIIMYSGNHSLAHPLATIIDAAQQLQDYDNLLFMFIGGGVGKKEIDELVRQGNLKNVISLPYQPLDQIKYSLSAADIHIVAMGEGMVGCVHPCKIYGAMSLARPILYVGPTPSHVSEIIEEHKVGWVINQNDSKSMIDFLKSLKNMDRRIILEMGAKASQISQVKWNKKVLLPTFCNNIKTAKIPS